MYDDNLGAGDLPQTLNPETLILVLDMPEAHLAEASILSLQDGHALTVFGHLDHLHPTRKLTALSGGTVFGGGWMGS